MRGCKKSHQENSAKIQKPAAALLAILITASVQATPDPAQDIEYKYNYYRSTYFLESDFSSTQTLDSSVKILSENAVRRMKSYSISYSTSIEEANIVEAYTEKSDGRKIAVPKNNFQVYTNSGKDGAGPVFSDRTNLTVVFPELAVGDSVVISYQIKDKTPMFPNQFSVSRWFSPNEVYDEATIKINVPAALKGTFKSKGTKDEVTVKDGRMIYNVHYTNPKPTDLKRQNYSVWQPETQPYVAYSTFESYRQIANAYGERATPKANVNERIQKLADQIAGTASERRQQANLLYDWVTTNISYAGNCIGVGAVVPHDTDFVLDNRMGDCKDHATLLQALLAAKGIKSHQALINAGSLYQLPKVPLVTAVNHVINYLPEFDLFVDSTDPTMPFGHLPFNDQDKPVIIVDDEGQIRRTPDSRTYNTFQTTSTSAELTRDGNIKGKIEIRDFGYIAASTRSRFRNMNPQSEASMLKNIFNNDGQIGSGSLTKDDPKPLTDRYQYSIDFEKKNYIQAENAGALFVETLFPTTLPIYYVGSYYSNEPEKNDVSCYSAKSEETFSLRLPASMEILATPKDLAISNDYIRYDANYKVEAGQLKVRRAVAVTNNGNICSPEVMSKMREVSMRIMKDIRSQVVYRFTDE